jgi:hypothetical protein
MLAHLHDQNRQIIRQIDFLRPIVGRLEAGKLLARDVVQEQIRTESLTQNRGTSQN